MSRIRYIQGLLSSGKLSCRELTQLYLEAAQRDNKFVNAFITITEETALEAAAKTDNKLADKEPLLPLEGIPFVLKDNISTAGLKTTCASKMLENYVPVFDAKVWELLKAQNAVLVGKGNMDEFAMGSTCENSYFGGARNPQNLDYVAGGSSGGVAAAVGANLSVFGIGSDTGGSIREPAGFCGVVGLKPTYGAVSRNGLIAYASSFDQIGPIAMSAEDAALVFDAISARDEGDMTSVGGTKTSDKLYRALHGVKIGVAPQFFEGAKPEVVKAVESAISVYKALGAEIISADIQSLSYALPVYYILACAEASSNLGRYDGIRYGYRAQSFDSLNEMICKTRSEGFGPEVRRRIMLGTYVLSAGYFDAYYKKAKHLQAKIRDDFNKVFECCDLILTPTTPVTAIRYGESKNMTAVENYAMDICTVTVNIAGLPAISTPCGFDDNGLPVGMQLIGKHFDEAMILNAACMFERETEGKFIRNSGLGVVV
jgi:aspartyl-tRNA(Asn)/glutamyl-tRNA(Gln) amidotransferase subunit A